MKMTLLFSVRLFVSEIVLLVSCFSEQDWWMVKYCCSEVDWWVVDWWVVEHCCSEYQLVGGEVPLQ